MRQNTGDRREIEPESVLNALSSVVHGPETMPNFGFPLEAAFAQLEGYARHLAGESDDPHCKLQLERVRTAALDLAATITNDLLNGQGQARPKARGRQTNQPALIDMAQLEALLGMAGTRHRSQVLGQLSLDIVSVREALTHPYSGAPTGDAARLMISVSEAIGAQRAARLAHDLLDGIDQQDTRKCGIVAGMLDADLAELLGLLNDMSPAANTHPAE